MPANQLHVKLLNKNCLQEKESTTIERCAFILLSNAELVKLFGMWHKCFRRQEDVEVYEMSSRFKAINLYAYPLQV